MNIKPIRLLLACICTSLCYLHTVRVDISESGQASKLYNFLTHKAPPIICTISNFVAFSKITKKA